MRHEHFFASSTAQHGFSMLEVLITLVIVATALLGTAGLQAYAMRMNQGAQFRTQAVFLASDIAERMEANKDAAVAGNYVLVLTSASSVTATPDCATAACSSIQLANWDTVEWGRTIASLKIPQASWQINPVSAVAGSNTYDIVIRWSDRRTDTTYAASNSASSAGINATGTAEIFSYTARRTIRQDAL